MNTSKVRAIQRSSNGNGWWITLENGLGRFCNPASPPYIGQLVSCADFGAGSKAEWIFQ